MIKPNLPYFQITSTKTEIEEKIPSNNTKVITITRISEKVIDKGKKNSIVEKSIIKIKDGEGKDINQE